MRKFLSRGIAVLAIVVAAAFADAQNVDQKIFGIETGVVLGYDVGTGNIGNDTSVALNLTLTDNLSAGFGFLSGAAAGSMPVTATLLSLQYGLADRYGMVVSLGRDTAAGTLLTGIGVYFNIFERKLQDAVATTLKARIEYLFAPTAPSAGDLAIGLCVGIGI